MPYTSEQQAEIKRQFVARRKKQLFVAIPLFLAIIALAMLGRPEHQDVIGVPPAVWGPAFLVVVLAALIFSFLNWRCPACNRYLGKQMSPRFCSKCGVVLQ